MHPVQQQAVAQFLTDTCEILDRKEGPGSLDESTLAVTFTEAVLYDGPCLVQASVRSRTETDGGEERQVDETVVRLGLDCPAIPNGAIVRILDSGNDHLIGAEFEVIRAAERTRRGSYRLTVRRSRSGGSTG